VIGDISSAIGRIKLDAHLAEHGIRRAQIFEPAIPSQRNYVGVLAEEQDIRTDADFAEFDSAALQITCRSVADLPEINQPTFVRGIRHRFQIRFL